MPLQPLDSCQPLTQGLLNRERHRAAHSEAQQPLCQSTVYDTICKPTPTPTPNMHAGHPRASPCASGNLAQLHKVLCPKTDAERTIRQHARLLRRRLLLAAVVDCVSSFVFVVILVMSYSPTSIHGHLRKTNSF